MHGDPWDDNERAFLRECSGAKIGSDRIAVALERTVSAVRTMRRKLRLPPPQGISYQMIGPRSPISVADIQRVTAEHFAVPVESMKSPSRKLKVARPRQVAMFFAREVARKSYRNIGSMFGGRDHSTVMHAVMKVERLMSQDHNFKDIVTTLERELVPSTRALGVDNSQNTLVSSARLTD